RRPRASTRTFGGGRRLGRPGCAPPDSRRGGARRVGASVAHSLMKNALPTAQAARSSLCSPRQVARERHPMHDPAESVVIVDGVVLGAAVVPEGEGARLPAEA